MFDDDEEDVDNHGAAADDDDDDYVDNEYEDKFFSFKRTIQSLNGVHH